jgi:hypothetical protein
MVNFIIAGSPKCGSTSIYTYLANHPEVCMSKEKEPGFFFTGYGQNDFSGSYAHYNGESLVGEATVAYFDKPDAVKRIFDYNPNMKLVFVFRDPVERLFSHYWQRLRVGKEFRKWNEVIEGEKQDYLFSYGRYFHHLQSFLKYFPKSQIHILFLEEFIKDPKAEIKRVCEFLGVEYFAHDEELIWEHRGYAIKNVGVFLWVKRWAGGTIFKQRIFRSIKPVGKLLLNRFYHYCQTPMLNKKSLLLKDKAFLASFYREDAEKLSNFLGRPLPYKYQETD